MTTPEQFIDIRATMGTADVAAMEVRNAIRNLLRAWENYHSLPPSFERRLESRPRTSGGHNKQDKE